MKKLLFFTIFCFAVATMLNAQTPELAVQSQLFGYEYQINGTPTNLESFRLQIADNPDALKMFNSGRSTAITGTVIGCIGAFSLGYDLGARLGGGKGNNGMLIGGGVVTIVGLILEMSGKSKMKKATTLFNNNNKQAWNISLEPKENGIALSFNF